MWGVQPLGFARIWGDALGREVRYAGNDLDAWQEQALRMLPGWMVYDFRIMYAMFQAKGLRATDAQLEETRTVVGASPRSFRDFAEKTAGAGVVERPRPPPRRGPGLP